MVMVGVVFLNAPRLLDWANSPPHLQFNKYVLTGYRPISPLGECVRSLFYLHNELGNIYTHGIPLLCFLFLLPLVIPWSQLSEPWLAVAHYLACVSPQLGSVLYHLFMNHEGGVAIYRTLLTLDMCGVCLVNTLGALPIIYCTLLCQPLLRTLALFSYAVLSSYAMYCALSAGSNVRRLRAFSWQACFRGALLLLRWLRLGAGSPGALRRYVLMEGLAAAGGFINIVRVPERWLPGAFDYCCNSHQIMHVLMVASILQLHWGVLEDLSWITGPRCPGPGASL
ncbi:progestin and adipoQ receptor family member 4a [Narcine bancroftii]|uniref:progestin and adipoQ receptor family member 4a n=1 Tax=Narcine bancroftii TaxID=1343680 RepID=UPI003831E1CF